MHALVYWVVFLITILIFRWYQKHRRFITLLEKVPGPPPLPILGNVLDFTSSKELLPKLIKHHQTYGEIIKLWTGISPKILFVTDYNFIKFILTSTEIANKANEYNSLRRWLGSGLILTDADAKWKKHRKLVAPVFHIQILEKLPVVFAATSKILLKKLEFEVGKESTEVCSYIKRCTLDIVADAVMGTPINAQENSHSNYFYYSATMCRVIVDRLFNPFLRIPFLYFFSSLRLQEDKAVEYLNNYVVNIIKKREKYFNYNCVGGSSVDKESKKNYLNFLDLLLFEKFENKSLTDEEIKDEVNTFMFAGYETTATVISFTIWCLAEHPEVQEKVVQELRHIFIKDKSRSATYQDLQQMKYLEAVIKESMRLFPPIPMFGRSLHKDLEYDGITLPKGLSIGICCYIVHRLEQYFSNPNVFIPERFLGENVTTQYPYCYIPFSMGPRNCLGQKLGMLVVKFILSAVLRNFEILPTTPKHELDLVSETVLKSTTGICVRFVSRNF